LGVGDDSRLCGDWRRLAAIGVAMGSIASQGVGLMTGNVQKFDCKQVGTSALSSAVTAGMQLSHACGELHRQFGPAALGC